MRSHRRKTSGGVLELVVGEAVRSTRHSRQIPEPVLSLVPQKLRGTTHQKLPMEMLVLEDEKHHRPESPSLQKVKVSARRSQCPPSAERPGSYSLAPPNIVHEPAAQHRREV